MWTTRKNKSWCETHPLDLEINPRTKHLSKKAGKELWQAAGIPQSESAIFGSQVACSLLSPQEASICALRLCMQLWFVDQLEQNQILDSQYQFTMREHPVDSFLPIEKATPPTQT